MIRRLTAMLGVAGLSGIAALHAAVPERYQTILDRNAFGLVPPPVVSDSEAAPVAPPLEIKITGFATIDGEKRVFFTVPAKKPQEFPQYFALREGEEQGGVHVLSISDFDGKVQVRNAGKELSLSLKDHGMQAGKGPVIAGTAAASPVGMTAVSPVSNRAGVQAPVGPASPVYNPNSSVVASGGAGPIFASTGSGSRGAGSAGIALPQNPSFPGGNGAGFMGGAPVAGTHNRGSNGPLPTEGPGGTPAPPGPNNPADPNQQPNFPNQDSPRPDYSDRGWWKKYYDDMGWPAGKPYPFEVADGLNPSP